MAGLGYKNRIVRVKVCGIQTLDDVDTCCIAGVDALGFIFAKSPRHLTISAASKLAAQVPPFIAKVGVFADNDALIISEAIDRCGLDILQFCGRESPQFRGAFGKPTIAVMHVLNENGSSLRSMKAQTQIARPAYSSAEFKTANVIALMVDSATATARGGTGIVVDTAIAASLRRDSRLPFMMAGGLTPENVSGIVKAVRPWAVDVRSGVERNGKKDPVLVKKFVKAAKGA